MAQPVVALVRAAAFPEPGVDVQSVIDYGPVIAHVIAAYGSEHYHRTRRLVRWHGGRPNGHGCYESASEVDLAHAGGAAAVAMAAVTGRGHWICG